MEARVIDKLISIRPERTWDGSFHRGRRNVDSPNARDAALALLADALTRQCTDDSFMCPPNETTIDGFAAELRHLAHVLAHLATMEESEPDMVVEDLDVAVYAMRNIASRTNKYAVQMRQAR